MVQSKNKKKKCKHFIKYFYLNNHFLVSIKYKIQIIS